MQTFSGDMAKQEGKPSKSNMWNFRNRIHHRKEMKKNIRMIIGQQKQRVILVEKKRVSEVGFLRKKINGADVIKHNDLEY